MPLVVFKVLCHPRHEVTFLQLKSPSHTLCTSWISCIPPSFRGCCNLRHVGINSGSLQRLHYRYDNRDLKVVWIDGLELISYCLQLEVRDPTNVDS